MYLRTLLTTALFGVSLSAFGFEYVPSLISVKVRSGNDAAATSAIKRVKGTVVRNLPQIGWKIVKLPATANIASVAVNLRNQSSLSKVERVGMDQLTETVNDPMAGQQWSLNRVQLPQAWDLSHGDRNVIVAIVDSGIDRGHPDLAGRVLQGYDVVNNDNDPDDDNSHGTHCAGIAAASTNNSVGVAGAGYNVTILPVKAANAAGGLSYEWEAAGIIYAADHGANIISMSFGGSGFSDLVNDACQYAYGKGALLVAAAGNSNSTGLFYPACFSNVINVASSDPDDSRSSFSNYGADHTHVAAPGSDILSTFPRSFSSTGYETESGTSMACPLVSGIAALALSYAGVGNLSNTELRDLIQDNVDTIGGNYVMYGRVNAYKTLLAIPLPLSDKPVPTDIASYEGILSSGDGPTIVNGDGISATIQSVKKSGVGLVGGMMSSFTPSSSVITPDEVRTATINLNVTGENLALLQVYLYKESTGKWALYSSKPTNGTAQSFSFKLDKAALQGWAPSGTLKVMLRAYVPTRLANRVRGITQVDELSVTYSGRRGSSTP